MAARGLGRRKRSAKADPGAETIAQLAPQVGLGEKHGLRERRGNAVAIKNDTRVVSSGRTGRVLNPELSHDRAPSLATKTRRGKKTAAATRELRSSRLVCFRSLAGLAPAW